MLQFIDETWDCNDERLPKGDIQRTVPDKGFLDSIAQGQLSPIIVRKDTEGKYHLEAGRRRLLAVRMLKEDARGSGFIAVRIFEGSETDGAWVTLVENAQRSANPVSDYQTVKKLLFKGQTYADIAKSIGESITYVKTLDQNFAHVPDWALVAILNEQMAVPTAKELGRLSDNLQEKLRGAMEQSPKHKLTMDMVKAEHRIVQEQATMQTMSFSGPTDNLRKIFNRSELEAIKAILDMNDPEQGVVRAKAYLQDLLAQEE
jgi:ParB/RepB/Spo0J family partition protein